MLQVVQHQKSGEIEILDLPAPTLQKGTVLVATRASLISAGTERTSVEKAKGSLINRARQQPEEVRKVLDMARKEGVASTVRKVLNKLDSYRTLGYSAAGEVLASDVDEFQPGDRVACAGAGYAVHAETIVVPRNLVVKLPTDVSFEEGACTTLASIAMQGVRQADPRLGETVVVVGLGLLGQITVALLRANGCRVIGLDIDESQFGLARELGADHTWRSDGNAIGKIEDYTAGVGADAVILTAGTSSNSPIELAIKVARKRGRVVVVGSVGMDLPRSPFYEKELEITIACSYGPGRYDPSYEEEGIDYPVGYVRWTEGRNMSAVVDLIDRGLLPINRTITHRFAVENAADAYRLITGESQESYLGVLLTYPERAGSNRQKSRTKISSAAGGPVGTLKIDFIGPGSFAQSQLMPHISAGDGIELVTAVTNTPANAKSAAEKFGYSHAATDGLAAARSSDSNALFIATQHDTHGGLVIAGLEAGKQVFVEKPLAITIEELAAIDAAAQSGEGRLMVGFNRRFSEPIRRLGEAVGSAEGPAISLYRVNAGAIPPEHWIQRPDQGGRIIGEVCHFVDTLTYLIGSEPVLVHAGAVAGRNEKARNRDTVSVTLRFADGSIGTILYLANGAKGLAKEYCEIHRGGKSGRMEDFREVTVYAGSRKEKSKFDGAKGHREEVSATLEAMKSGREMPITYESLLTTSLATIAVVESISTGQEVRVEDLRDRLRQS